MINRLRLWKKAAIVIIGGGVLCFTYVIDVNSAQKSAADSFYFLKRGMFAYKNGQINQAISDLQCAARMGNIGASWKLGHIYADGDGVPEDDYRAYKFFAHIVKKGAYLGSEDESYVSDALVKLADYIKKGIPRTFVKANPSYAAYLYMRAAVNYRNPTAQYQLGKMFLKREGREKNLLQAARWFQLSARKGNHRAQAMLGNMILQAGKTVRGVAMLTIAYEKANVKDRDWIRPMQEYAFSICNEFEKRAAVSLVDDILKNNSS